MTKPVSRRLTWFVVLLAICPALLMVGSTSCAAPEAETGKMVVAVSLLPQSDFVEVVGGDRVEVVVMVPPGASPHTYEVTPEQMVMLSQAVMYAKVGSPVEFELVWLDKLISANLNMLVVDCARGIELMEMHDDDKHDPEEADYEHEHTGLDPHIWLSVKNVEVMVSNICDGLTQIDPENSAYYETNRDAYLESLTQLDNDLEERFSGFSNRSFIVFHPAFGYFARDYDLEQIAVEQDGKEPSADYIIRLIEEAKERDIRVVFVSPQYDSKSAEVIAGEIGGRVLIIDPLAKDFINNMRMIEAAMRAAME